MSSRWNPVADPVTGLVRPVRLDPNGETGPTRGQARASGWRRVTRGWYVATSAGPSVEQRILEQSVRAPKGAVTGWAALRMHGAGLVDGIAPDGVTSYPVPLIEGEGRVKAHPAIVVSRDRLDVALVTTIHGVRCVGVERALYDEMRRVGELREAVVTADMTFAAELTSISRMRRYVLTRRRSAARALVLAALDLASEHSRSPMETRLRLIWVLDAGWATPLCNRRVLTNDGVVLGRPDLLDPEHGVTAEFNGADHRERETQRIDVKREDLLRRAGLEPTTFVGADLHDRALVVERLVEARIRAASRPRGWRLGPEPESLDSVIERRDALRAIREEQTGS